MFHSTFDRPSYKKIKKKVKHNKKTLSSVYSFAKDVYGMVKSEWKYNTFNDSGNIGYDSLDLITATRIQAGQSFQQRTGDKVILRRLTYRGTVNYSGSGSNLVRLLIIKFRKSGDSDFSLSSSDIISLSSSPGTCISDYNFDKQNYFEILCDKPLVLSVYRISGNFKVNVDFPDGLMLQYDEDSSGSSPNNYDFYRLFLSANSTTTTTFVDQTRVWYTDS